MILECVERDKLYAGIKAAQLCAHLGKTDVLMLPTRYYQQAEERMRKEAEKLKRRIERGKVADTATDKAPAIYTCTHTYTYTHIYTHAHTHIYKAIHIRTHTHIYIYKYIHIAPHGLNKPARGSQISHPTPKGTFI